MGCKQSKIDNRQPVSRCNDRKILMKQAIAARNAFAAAHSGYFTALKDVGAALSDYGRGEGENQQQNKVLKMNSRRYSENLPSPSPPPPPPPPPPLPCFIPNPVDRSVEMPEVSVFKTGGKLDAMTVNEVDDDGGGGGGDGGDGGLRHRRRSERNVVKLLENDEVTQMRPPLLPESKGGLGWDYFFTVGNMPVLNKVEEDDDGSEEIEDHVFDGKPDTGKTDQMEPKAPEKLVEEAETHFVKRNAKQIGRSNAVSCVNLSELFEEIDDHFLKASENAQEVSKMLAANRVHYHTKLNDNLGQIDHSARVMSFITWNGSFRGAPNGDSAMDGFDCEQYETHATVLDKLLVWEKKLFVEVKTSEMAKILYRRKVVMLNKQKKRGVSSDSLDKLKAVVSHLHTRYIVDVQSMDSTASEVSQIRDSQLYPKLVALVDGLANMWQDVSIHHESQLKIASNLKSLDTINDPIETSQEHHDRTVELWNVVQEWSSQFEKLVNHQKQYVQLLNRWLKLNVNSTENKFKESQPPIHSLLLSWNDYLEKLPDDVVKAYIASFSAVIEAIIVHQDEEIKMKEKCNETEKEFWRKNQAFEDWFSKYKVTHKTENQDDHSDVKDQVSERRFVVESLKKRLDDEVEAYQRHCLLVREKSLVSLKTSLPALFRALSDYARACHDAYDRLRFISKTQKQNGGS